MSVIAYLQRFVPGGPSLGLNQSLTDSATRKYGLDRGIVFASGVSIKIEQSGKRIVWWTGLQVLNSVNIVRKLESLVTEAMSTRRDMVECWQVHTRKTLLAANKTEVHVMPTGRGKTAMVCLRERTPE